MQVETGMKYYFKMRATNLIGAGPFTEIVEAIAITHPDAPIVDSVVLTREDVSVRWSEPNTQGATISGYKLEAFDLNGETHPIQQCSQLSTETQCSFPTETLFTEPFSLQLGQSLQL